MKLKTALTLLALLSAVAIVEKSYVLSAVQTLTTPASMHSFKAGLVRWASDAGTAMVLIFVLVGAGLAYQINAEAKQRLYEKDRRKARSKR